MIAISYRREDSTPVAGRLHDRLQADFGRGNVFMDFDSIPYGVDFREQIKQMLERARVVIAIIGPTWVGGRTKGNRRIDDPADFVRLEIALALQRGIPVIPVLLDDTPMPKAENLPSDLQGLAFRNALTLDTGVDFHHHVDRLIAGIRNLVHVPARPILPPLPEDKGAEAGPDAPTTGAAWKKELPFVDPQRRKKIILIGERILLVALVVALGWYIDSTVRRSHDQPPSSASATPMSFAVETPIATVAPNSISTPPATSFPEVTPIAIPTEAPPLPSTNVITDSEVQAFIPSFYRAIERKDLAYLLGQYDESVDYQTYGRRDKAFIGDDYVKYFKRWPITSFAVGEIRMRRPDQNNITVSFDVRFSVRDSASSRSKDGRASEEWTMAKSYGALKVTSQRETVYADTSAAPSVAASGDSETIRQFVRDYYAALERRDINGALMKFDNVVNYQGNGNRNRSYIRNDLYKYLSKWTRLNFNLGSIDVSQAPDGRFVVAFAFDYSVSNNSNQKSGRASDNWVLRMTQGGLRIVSQQESVQRY